MKSYLALNVEKALPPIKSQVPTLYDLQAQPLQVSVEEGRCVTVKLDALYLPGLRCS